MAISNKIHFFFFFNWNNHIKTLSYTFPFMDGFFLNSDLQMKTVAYTLS